MNKVIYLTGAPASGKSSTTRALAALVPDLAIWEYGARLTEHIKTKVTSISNQSELRSLSGNVVSSKDIEELDKLLVKFVELERVGRNVIIDSHAVTKEVYGYRITPFSLEDFSKLSVDEIWVLFCSPEETRRRIMVEAGGRPLVSEEEARIHTALQASVAATYGMSIGKPVYFFDTEVSRDGLIERLAERIS